MALTRLMLNRKVDMRSGEGMSLWVYGTTSNIPQWVDGVVFHRSSGSGWEWDSTGVEWPVGGGVE